METRRSLQGSTGRLLSLSDYRFTRGIDPGLLDGILRPISQVACIIVVNEKACRPVLSRSRRMVPTSRGGTGGSDPRRVRAGSARTVNWERVKGIFRLPGRVLPLPPSGFVSVRGIIPCCRGRRQL